MARKSSGKHAAGRRAEGLPARRKSVRGSSPGVLRAAAAAGTTGRFIVVFRPGEAKAGAKALQDKAGVAALASTADSASGALDADEVDGENVLFDKLDMAVVDMPEDGQRGAASAAVGGEVLMIVPETVKTTASLPGAGLPQPAPAVPWAGGPPAVLAWPDGGVPPVPVPVWPDARACSPDYLRGVLDTVRFLMGGHGYGLLPPVAFVPATPVGPSSAGAVPGEPTQGPSAAETAPGPPPSVPVGLPAGPMVTAAAGGFDEAALGHTWGLEVTQVIGSQLTGKGVKVAILNTGLDLGHRDCRGRKIVARSFVPGRSAQDSHGEGTHLTGTACGANDPGISPRYGIAYEADIYIGKVLDDSPPLAQGKDKWVLGGHGPKGHHRGCPGGSSSTTHSSRSPVPRTRRT
jgi:subtilisin family serine protease